MTASLLSLLMSFALSVLIAPVVIHYMKKLKASQPILGYVDNHSEKSGCPTMGGVIFILPVILITLLFSGQGMSMGKYACLIILAYGIIGFLDDFIKVRYKDNKGLRAYQKIIGQFAVALIIAFYAYNNPNIGSAIKIPFTTKTIDLGIFYIPFIVVLFIATTNSVNLTDGLDGLAGSTSAVYFTTFLIMLLISSYYAKYYGQVIKVRELNSLAIFTACFIGSILAFLLFNFNPAKIFMGDTGSLAIGGGACAVAVFMKNPLIILIIGFMFVLSSISVIVQVIYFKLTKGKRIFLMAPLHHHFQYKGVKEWKIVTCYTIITTILGVITLLSFRV